MNHKLFTVTVLALLPSLIFSARVNANTAAPETYTAVIALAKANFPKLISENKKVKADYKKVENAPNNLTIIKAGIADLQAREHHALALANQIQPTCNPIVSRVMIDESTEARMRSSTCQAIESKLSRLEKDNGFLQYREQQVEKERTPATAITSRTAVYKQYGFSPSQIAKIDPIIKNRCKGTPATVLTANIMDTIPYAAKGNCYIVGGTVAQVVNSHTALILNAKDWTRVIQTGIDSDVGSSVLMVYSTGYAPPKDHPTLVLAKGEGVFKYEATSGEKRVVPKLTTLYDLNK